MNQWLFRRVSLLNAPTPSRLILDFCYSAVVPMSCLSLGCAMLIVVERAACFGNPVQVWTGPVVSPSLHILLLQQLVGDCPDFLVSPWIEASLQSSNTPMCYRRSLSVYASHPLRSKQSLQLQIFTTGSTTTSSSTSTTSSSSWDSIWSFKYLRRWFPTNLTATRCTHHQLRQALLNWRLARPPSC